MKDKIIELANSFRREYKEQIDELIKSKDFSNINTEDTITLFHGTNTKYLNSILTNGILNRKEIGISNWNEFSSMESLVYLTNKWHYFYAINSLFTIIDDLKKDEQVAFPCYVECVIPKDLIVVDEDFFISNYSIKKARNAFKKNKEFTLTWEECLAQYGTVAVLGNIPVKYIKSFTILGDVEYFMEELMADDCQYKKDYIKWQSGKGKGDLNINDLIGLESKSKLNGTWWLKDLKKNSLVEDIIMNPNTGKISIVFS